MSPRDVLLLAVHLTGIRNYGSVQQANQSAKMGFLPAIVQRCLQRTWLVTRMKTTDTDAQTLTGIDDPWLSLASCDQEYRARHCEALEPNASEQD